MYIMILIYALTLLVFVSLHQYINTQRTKTVNTRPMSVPDKFLSFKNAMKSINNCPERQLPI